MNNKFRASFSILKMWESGAWDKAIEAYFKMSQFTTRSMEEGKEYHEGWQKETNRTQCLPSVFGAKKLTSPKTELKLVVALADWLDLVGVIDCLDGDVIYEYKTGKTNSEIYLNSVQPAVYGVLAVYSGFVVKKAEIYHFDQHSKKMDMSIVWLTDRVIDDAYEWIFSVSSEMYAYFNENDLFNRFGK